MTADLSPEPPRRPVRVRTRPPIRAVRIVQSEPIDEDDDGQEDPTPTHERPTARPAVQPVAPAKITPTRGRQERPRRRAVICSNRLTLYDDEHNEQDGSFSPLGKLKVYQWLAREVVHHVTPAEFVVLCRLTDQSVGMNRRHWVGTIDYLLRGKEGVCVPMPMKRRWLLQTLGDLEAKGLIRRTRDRYGLRIAVNLEWPVPEIIRLRRRRVQT